MKMHRTTDTMQSITLDQSPVTDADPNNNKKSEKYSLRQRSRRETSNAASQRIQKQSSSSSLSSSSATGTATSSGTSSPELRGVKEKIKSKAAPLSKYRRKTANARERTRMREINSAFENLRKCVPTSMCAPPQPQQQQQQQSASSAANNEKLTKITTLRLAMKYIRTLSECLARSTATTPTTNISDNNILVSNNNNNNNNNNNSLSINNNNNCKDEFSNESIYLSNPLQTNIGRISHKNSIYHHHNYHHNNNNNNYNNNNNNNNNNNDHQQYKSSKESKYRLKQNFSPCLSPPMDDSPADLGLILESDGESLQLSEPCLSPLGQSMKPFNCTSTDNPLELGLLLESDSESLQLSEPCLSPLGPLDPFGDLLHTGFSEQTALDMYLT